MKFRIILPLITLFALSCGQSSNSDKNGKSESTTTESSSKKTIEPKPAKTMFDIKAAKIVFNYTGGPETGTETLYFDDYGTVAVLVVDKKMQFGHTNQTTIWKDNQSTIIDHEKKIVSKSPFRPKATEPAAIADTDEQTRKNIGYEKLASEIIAGKTCEVWFNAKQNFKYWLWNKIELKKVLGTSINKEAISVEEITEIPASVMEIPSGDKKN